MEATLQPPPGARAGGNRDTLARGKASAPSGWGQSQRSKMSTTGQPIVGLADSSAPSKRMGPSLGMPSTADKTKIEGQAGANSTAVKSPVSGHLASQFRARTRNGSRGHAGSDARAKEKILKDMRQNNLQSYDGEAHKLEMERL
jgi:hypothetical protein